MFVYIKHGENDHFIVNTYCPVTFLMQHIRAKLGLAESELIDLCDKQGAMTCLFLPQNTQKWAHELLKPRESFIVCSVNRTSDGAYSSVTSLLSGVDSALLESLQGQIDNLERTRLKQFCVLEAPSAELKESTVQAPPKTTKKLKGRPRK
ncbi:uncharacterized protein CXorf65 homolog [Triplophysa rosa]|uniref:uncharacterized protein CXorf65 homolog n=1 Tax=Triplophysa rosa TaxID=992332 RepID=UPI0025462648|nr:uncharacterized protein CXorf65 homolog [Triplophysa rosa]